jgi:hypothetical protein
VNLPRTSKIVNTTATTNRITLTHRPTSNFPMTSSPYRSTPPT